MAENYVLVTDSACDISLEKLAEWKVELIRMPFLFTDTGKEQLDHDEPLKSFYSSMRSGRIAKTSGLNEDVFVQTFTPLLEEGKDVLYLAFSSGLSVTCENGKKVAASLKEKYPEREIIVIDSLAASGGEGLFVWLAVCNRDAGMSLAEKPPYFSNPAGRIGLLSGMYTLPEYRRRGIGRRLLGRVVDEARAWGCGAVQITASDMGVLLYADFGFVKNGNFMQLKL